MLNSGFFRHLCYKTMIETDYLIIGAGAMGMAFADEILTKQPKARLCFVDRRSKPGGHWNDAYSFVRLHQPSAYYGVNSKVLGRGGAYLSSKSEILDYYDALMQRFIKSGRVKFFNSYSYKGNGEAESIIDDSKTVQFKILQKEVDATYMKVEVPATHTPKFKVEENVTLIPPNDLPKEIGNWKSYVVVGGGKTGIDAILFLLENNISSTSIKWIVPNEAWLWNRAHVQPGHVSDEILGQINSLINAVTINDVFLDMEKRDSVFRIDTEKCPKKWRCATVNKEELEKLRAIKNIISKGRVQKITSTEIHFKEEQLPYEQSTLFVNCTANALAKLNTKPIFTDKLITLQSLFFCQQVFSAATIARLELLNISNSKRNQYAKPVAHPEFITDWPEALLLSFENFIRINKLIPLWIYKSRLNFMSHEPLFKYLISSIKGYKLYSKTPHILKRLET